MKYTLSNRIHTMSVVKKIMFDLGGESRWLLFFLVTLPFTIEILGVIGHILHLEQYQEWKEWDMQSKRSAAY